MNPYERAVIAAARRYALLGDNSVDYHNILLEAVNRLEEYERSQDPSVTEGVPWGQVAEGDHLKSVINGKFYEVEKVLAVKRGRKKMHRITLKNVPNVIERPTDKELTATVRRGPTGRAVDIIVNTFATG